MKEKSFLHVVDFLLDFCPSVKRICSVFIPVLRSGKCNIFIWLNVLAGLFLVLLGCMVNLTIPIYNKKIVDSLKTHSFASSSSSSFSGSGQHHGFFDLWPLVLFYVFLKALQGIGPISLLHCAQSYFWLQIQDFTERRVQTEFFRHVQHLSVHWHTEKKTSDVLGALETGSSSILSILEHVLFSLLPTIVDILVAIIYLSLYFGSDLGYLILLQVTSYLILTIYLSEKRVTIHQPFYSAFNDMKNQALESLYNFQTVKCFTREESETERFSERIKSVQQTRKSVSLSLIFMQFLQVLILYSGLFVGVYLVITDITRKGHRGGGGNSDTESFSVGDYVLLTSYLSQLYGPLNYLGTYYRELRTNLVDLEWMLQIFEMKGEEQCKIRDEPHLHQKSPSTCSESGQIEFRNVSFGYGKGEFVLKNISFVVPPKKIVALVGPSGSGKSSILKLLLRFYDVNAGEVMIDGKNIKNFSHRTIRQMVGVVPQETTLFSDTLRQNIKYAKEDATESEIVSAVTRACLHHKIITLPDAYNTQVGERGLKVSGGEKQRLGISRIFLKNPPFILLDEVTSSLDIHTEHEIVDSLQDLCRSRTCLIITHRIWTIQHADEILVLKNGSIIERGRHKQLLSQPGGMYASMWTEQMKKHQNSSG